jgi:hypothetical protein
MHSKEGERHDEISNLSNRSVCLTAVGWPSHSLNLLHLHLVGSLRRKGTLMKKRLSSFLMLAVLMLGGIMFIPGVTYAITTLSDTLAGDNSTFIFVIDQGSTGGSTQWVASSFGTDNTSYDLNTVTLLMTQIGTTTAEVSIYTDNSNAPGTQLGGALTSPASYIGSPGLALFTASGITLSPNTTYWVVLKAVGPTGYLEWEQSSGGSGVGYLPGTRISSDSGEHWLVETNPMAMKVEATTVPLPPAVALLGAGLIPLVWFRRRNLLGK